MMPLNESAPQPDAERRRNTARPVCGQHARAQYGHQRADDKPPSHPINPRVRVAKVSHDGCAAEIARQKEARPHTADDDAEERAERPLIAALRPMRQ
jgi:hypothetical protein